MDVLNKLGDNYNLTLREADPVNCCLDGSYLNCPEKAQKLKLNYRLATGTPSMAYGTEFVFLKPIYSTIRKKARGWERGRTSWLAAVGLLVEGPSCFARLLQIPVARLVENWKS